MRTDEYKTLVGNSEAIFTEKRSKFLAFSFHLTSIEEVRLKVDELQKKYYDARHVCYAYMLGAERLTFRANDNGEPSGTAGKPILGQINSLELTDVLVVVVRYFGGVKLGTSGLIVAYREAAREALENAEHIIKTVDDEVSIKFEYPFLNSVMRIVKEEEPKIVSQEFDMDCFMKLSIRRESMENLRNRFSKVETLSFCDTEETD